MVRIYSVLVPFAMIETEEYPLHSTISNRELGRIAEILCELGYLELIFEF